MHTVRCPLASIVLTALVFSFVISDGQILSAAQMSAPNIAITPKPFFRPTAEDRMLIAFGPIEQTNMTTSAKRSLALQGVSAMRAILKTIPAHRSAPPVVSSDVASSLFAFGPARNNQVLTFIDGRIVWADALTYAPRGGASGDRPASLDDYMRTPGSGRKPNSNSGTRRVSGGNPEPASSTATTTTTSGLTSSEADSRYVNVSGDQMAGALVITYNGLGLSVSGTASGDVLHAERLLTVSGTSIFDGNARFNSTLTLNSVTYTFPQYDGASSGKVLKTNAAGQLSWSDDNAVGTGLSQASGDSRYVNTSGDTMTGALTINLSSGTLGLRILQTASGNILHAEKDLTSSGTLTVVGVSRFKNNVNVAGTISGQTLQIMNGTSYVLGNLGIGTATPKSKLEVLGSLSGSRLYVASAFSGAGLTTCSSAGQKLLWSATTQQFSCSTDLNTVFGSGNVLTLGDNRYLRTSGGTLTGALTIALSQGTINTVGLNVLSTVSGAILHAEKTLTSSGGLVFEGAATGSSLFLGTSLRGAGLTDCTGGNKLLWNAAIGRFSCGVDQSAGTGLDQNSGDARYVNQSGDTMTGALTINLSSGFLGLRILQTASGNILHAEKDLTSSGTLTVASTTRLKSNLNVVGTISGAALQIMHGNSYILGSLGIGMSTAPKAKLEIQGTLSGSRLYVASAFSGAGLTSCSGAGQKLLWNATTQQFSCSTDLTSVFGSGNVLALGDSRYVNTSGDTMTGALTINLSSGTLGLKILQTASGNILHAEKDLSSSGTLTVVGVSRFKNNVNVVGTISGTTLQIMHGTSYVLGSLGIGTNSPKAKLDVAGTISGSTLVISRNGSFSGSLLVVSDIVSRGTLSGNSLTVSRSASISGTLLVKSSIVTKGSLSGTTIAGFSLGSCNAATQKLLYNNSTQKFECGSDANNTFFGSGNVLTIGDSRYVKKQGDTMTGALVINLTTGSLGLRILQTASGNILHAEKALTSSGMIMVTQRRVQGSGALTVLQLANSTGVTIRGSGAHINAPLLALDSSTGSAKAPHILFGHNGVFDVSLYRTTGSVLNLSGHLLPGLTNTFDLGSSAARWRSLYLSGGTLYLGTASNQASISYNTSASRFGIDANTDGTNELSILSTGNIGIGTIAPKAKLDVQGTISGSNLVISRSASISGTLLVKSSIVTKGSLSGTTIAGFSLGTCNGAGQKLLYNNSTQKFECGSDQTGTAIPFGSGNVLTIGDARYVKKQGDTMTGTLVINLSSGHLGLRILQTASGNVLHAEKALTSSGMIMVTQRQIQGSGAFVVNQLANSTGVYIQSTVANGNAPLLALDNATGSARSPHILFGYKGRFDVAMYRTTGSVLNLSGHLLPGLSNKFDLGSSAARWRSLYLSGGTLYLGSANNQASINYNTSASRFGIDSNADGTNELSILSTGSVGIGTIVPKAKLDVQGTISGSNLVISRSASISGTLLVKSRIETKGTLSGVTITGFSLGSCNDANNSKLLYNNSTQKFECGTDQNSTGLSYSNASGIFLKKSGGTMTGALTINLTSGFLGLRIVNTASGNIIHAEKSLTSSGTILATGNISTRATLSGAALTVMSGNSYLLGSVGIGTTSPKAKLDVLGTLSGKVLVISGNGSFSGSLTVKNNLSGSALFSFGLGSCSNSSTSKLLYNNSTGKFSCGTDQTGSSNNITTGAVLTIGDARYVKKQGDTMTGTLKSPGFLLASGTTLVEMSGWNESLNLIHSGLMTNSVTRLTKEGDLKNIGTIQAGEANFRRGGTFIQKTDYATGARPNAVMVGDLNGDEKPDLVVANSGSNTLSVFINTGSNTFVAKVDYAAGTRPLSVSIGDFNGDGKPDLAAVANGAAAVSVFLNNGNGTFRAKVDYATGTNPISVAIGDLNGDGRPDLAVANQASTTVSVFMNNGNGLFATKVDYATGTTPWSVAIGDLSGDGKADLAIANYGSAKVSVLLNNGNGVFATKVDFTTGTNPTSVAIGDLSGDGKPDLAVTNSGSTSVSIFTNNGTGGVFAAKADYVTASGPQSVAISDINGDAKADLAVVNQSSATVSIFINNGVGIFASKVDYATGTDPKSVAIGDLNSDGKADLAVANNVSNTVSVFLNNSKSILYASAGTGGAVGIGTSTPNSALSVSGAVIISRLGTLGNGSADAGLALEVIGTMSGRIIHAQDLLTSSGTLIVEGTISGSTLQGAGLGTCNGATQKLLYNNSTKKFECGTDLGSGIFGTGNVLTIGDSRYLRQSGGTMTGALTINLTSGSLGLRIINTASGNIIHAEKSLTSSGTIIATGNITSKSSLSGAALFVGGMTDCTNATTSKVLYNIATGKFSCGTDQTAAGLTYAGALGTFVNQSGDTMTGALTINLTSGTLGLKIVQTASGNMLHAEKDLSSSGTLTVVGVSRFKNNVNVVGTISGAALQIMNGTSYVLGNLGIGTTSPKAKLDVQGTISGTTLVMSGNGSFSGSLIVKNNLSGSTISGFSLGTCNGTTQKLLYNNSTRKFECGSDLGGTFSSGNVLTIGDARYLRTSGGTMTGALTINLTSGSLGLKIINTASGNILHAEKTLTSSGNIIAGTDIVAKGTIKSDAFVFSSGTTLAEMSGWNEYLNIVHSGLGTNSVTRLTNQGNLVNIGTIQSGEAHFRRGGTFLPKEDYATGTTPYSVAVGDLNGDGKSDLAVANYGSNSVSVFIGTGSGLFVSKVDYTTGSLPISVSIGDLNGDGKADLAVANISGDSVSVLLNKGNGTFTSRVDYTAGDTPVSVSIGDLNGDGKADLAVASSTNSNFVSVFLNNGNGTFASKVDYATGNGPNSVAIGDLNGDGKADLAVSNYSSNSASVFLNNGNGTFASKVDYTTASAPKSISIADLNGDGKADFAVANYSSISASVFLNNGNGTFASKVDYTTGETPISISIGDLSGDGKPDIATANYAGSAGTTVSVLLNNGNGTFSAKVDYTTGTGPYSVAAGDLNGDGKADLAVANNGSNSISVLLNVSKTILYASAGTGGAVGIGTSTPGSALAVSGAVIINRGGNLFNAGADTGVTLEVIGTASGRTLHAQDLLRSSGSLVIEKTATFGSGVFINTRHTTARANVLTIITDYSTNNNTVFRVSASGSVYADGVFNSAGADYAEWFRDGSMEGLEGREGAEGKKPLQPGEVACIDVLHNNTVKRCERSGDPNVMGIVSTNPAFVGNVISGAEGLIPPGYALIGLIGQVPAKPTLENGQIFPGDAVTSASVPGFIRKASAGESTVGVALEAYNGEIPNSKNQIPTINILISRRNQSLTVETLEQKVLDQIASMNLTDQIAQLVNQASINLNIDDRVTEALNAELATFDLASEVNMLVDEHLSHLSGSALTFGQSLHFGSGQALTGADLTSLAQAVAAELALATSEQVTATGSSTENYELGMMNYESRLKDLEEQFALRFGSGQALRITETSSGQSLHGSATSLMSDSGATINGSLHLSGSMIVNDQFYILHSTFPILSISGSAVTIGSLMSTGSLTLLGNLTINGLATFFGDVHIKGELILSNRQAGFAVIPASGTAVTVTFSGGMVTMPIVNVSPDAPVLYAVTKVSATGFTIRIAEALPADVRFSYVAISADQPTTTVGDTQASTLIPFPVNSFGQPVSSDAVWNGCIQGRPLLGADGVPFSCSRYHDDHTWEHPDLHISFIYNPNHDPAILTIPEGYEVVVVSEGGTAVPLETAPEPIVPEEPVSDSGSAVLTSTGSDIVEDPIIPDGSGSVMTEEPISIESGSGSVTSTEVVPEEPVAEPVPPESPPEIVTDQGTASGTVLMEE